MDDRIAELKAALADADHLFDGSEIDSLRVLVEAARAYADLLENGAVIIKKGGNNQWPKWVVDTFKATSDPRWALDVIADALVAVVPGGE